MAKWIDFRLLDRPEGRKTDIYNVWNKEFNSLIGKVSWYAPWRKYAFYPTSNTVFEQDCLKDISDFLNKLMEERKNDK